MDREFTVVQPAWSPLSSTVLAGHQGSSEPEGFKSVIAQVTLRSGKIDSGEATWWTRLPALLANPALAFSAFSLLSPCSVSEACVHSLGFVDVETPTLFKRTPGVCILLVTPLTLLQLHGQFMVELLSLATLSSLLFPHLQLTYKFLLKAEAVKGERWHLVS